MALSTQERLRQENQEKYRRMLPTLELADIYREQDRLITLCDVTRRQRTIPTAFLKMVEKKLEIVEFEIDRRYKQGLQPVNT